MVLAIEEKPKMVPVAEPLHRPASGRLSSGGSVCRHSYVNLSEEEVARLADELVWINQGRGMSPPNPYLPSHLSTHADVLRNQRNFLETCSAAKCSMRFSRRSG